METKKQTSLEIGSLDTVTAAEWAELIKSVVREDKEHSCAVYKKPIPAAVQALPNHAACTRLQGGSAARRDYGEIVAVISPLQRLRGPTRQNMRTGFNSVLAELTDSTLDGADDVLFDVFTFAVLVRGMLQRETLTKMLARQGLREELRERVQMAYRSARH